MGTVKVEGQSTEAEQPKQSETSLAYSISLMESYFTAKKLGDSKFHKILFVSGPIIGFLLAFICFYAIFLGVTDQSNKIFEKKDLEIKEWQKMSEHYRRIHEGNREAIIHEKYEDTRQLSEELESCKQSQAQTLEEVVGLQNDLWQTRLASKERIEEIQVKFNTRIEEKNAQLRKLITENRGNKVKIDNLTAAKQVGNILLTIAAVAAIALFAIFKPNKQFLYNM